MTFSRIALIAATALVSACGSDGTTSPADSPNIDTRLAAVAFAPTAAIGDPYVSMRVEVTSSLQEVVTGGACAQTVEARPVNGTTWTDVTAESFACSANAIVISPNATADVTAVADQAEVRAVAGNASSVVLRARTTVNGTGGDSYILQSSEVTWQLP